MRYRQVQRLVDPTCPSGACQYWKSSFLVRVDAHETSFGYRDAAHDILIPIHWSVSRPAPRGFKFTSEVRDWHDPQASGEAYECTIDNGGGTDPGDCNGPDWYEDTQVSGSVCGESPYAAPWDIGLRITSNDQSDGAYGLATVNYALQMSLPEGQTVPSREIAGSRRTRGCSP
jgi:hypothetical protein